MTAVDTYAVNPVSNDDRTHLIELRSGRFLSLSDPNPDDITLADIAHGLSLTCRFSGQCSRFYSVAEHALLVADRIAELDQDLELQLQALHHDDSEAFITDVPRPAKSLLPDYAVIEQTVTDACEKALGIFPPRAVAAFQIHEADQWALAQEAGELMTSRGQYWSLGYSWDGTARHLGAYPYEAKANYLRRHHELARVLQW